NYSEYFTPKKKKNYSEYSIENILRGMPNEKIVDMRENIIKLVPKIVYTKPNRQKTDEETLEDAFDVAVKGVVERIKGIRRKIQD
ncbi:BnaCnng39550D, partial [Brassica napus]